MKKQLLILAMLLAALTAYNQTSRRTSNNTRPAEKTEKKSEANDNSQIRRTSVNKTETKTKNTTTTNTYRDDRKRNMPVERTVTNDDSRRKSNPATVPANNNRNNEYENNRRTGGYVNTPNKRETSVPAPVDRNRRPIKREVNPPVQNQANHNPKPEVKYVSSRRYVGTRPVIHHYERPPQPVYYRAKHNPYRMPVIVNIVWTDHMHYQYTRMYPTVNYWHYPVGYRIKTISAYDAMYYVGEVVNVYGRVQEVFYSHDTDEYFLYYGAYYPYQDFTVVIPGRIARKYSRRPQLFFENEHIQVIGLVTSFNDSPEIVVKRTSQLNVY